MLRKAWIEEDVTLGMPRLAAHVNPTRSGLWVGIPSNSSYDTRIVMAITAWTIRYYLHI